MKIQLCNFAKKYKEDFIMKYNKLYGTTFYGNEASNYAKEDFED